MKKLGVFAALMLPFSLSLISCGGDDPVNTEAPISISDSGFKQFLVDNYDINKDGEISLSEAQKVTKINCSGKVINNLDGIRNFTALVELDCSSIKNLKSLDVREISTLKKLDCSGCNNLSSVNVSNNPALETLDISNTNVKSIDISNNIALKQFYCTNCAISALDLSKNVALEDLECDHNKLSTIDLSANVALKTLDCSNNSLSDHMYVTVNTELRKLNCKNNKDLKYVSISAKLKDIITVEYDNATTTIQYVL